MTDDCSFVLDADGKVLAPTKVSKAWYLIRKGKAKLIARQPMTIQLVKTVESDEVKVFWS